MSSTQVHITHLETDSFPFPCCLPCFTQKASCRLNSRDIVKLQENILAARHWSVNPHQQLREDGKADCSDHVSMCNLQPSWGQPPLSSVCCSNKTDLLKYISRTAAVRTSNVSQSEIKYSILFGTSQPNSIFLPSIATKRPSIWQPKDVLSPKLDSGPPSLVPIIQLHPLPHFKPHRSHRGESDPLPLHTAFREKKYPWPPSRASPSSCKTKHFNIRK